MAHSIDENDMTEIESPAWVLSATEMSSPSFSSFAGDGEIWAKCYQERSPLRRTSHG